MFLLYQMFSITNPYMAKEAIQGTMPGQLSLYPNQVVQVMLTIICNKFFLVNSCGALYTIGVRF